MRSNPSEAREVVIGEPLTHSYEGSWGITLLLVILFFFLFFKDKLCKSRK